MGMKGTFKIRPVAESTTVTSINSAEIFSYSTSTNTIQDAPLSPPAIKSYGAKNSAWATLFKQVNSFKNQCDKKQLADFFEGMVTQPSSHRK